MAAGNTQQGIRKAIGVLKDSTKVGLVNLNSDKKRLDIAIVKATNHDEVPPKEKHIKTILDAVSASKPRADVAYCIQGLAKRLTKTRSWTVALKSLIVIHRSLREAGPTFCQELINYSRGRARMLNLSHFSDDSSQLAWDYSAWIRAYALYLEERVECYRILKYDIIDQVNWKNKRLKIPDLLQHLAPLQQLLFRLLGCKPEGAASSNSLIHHGLSIVVGESVNLYVAITDGIFILVENYFEMQSIYAIRTLEIYKKFGNQAESLSRLFEICRGLEFGRGQKYVKTEQPPESFLAAMEDHVKDSTAKLDIVATPETDLLPKKHEISPICGKTLADVLSERQHTDAGSRAGQILKLDSLCDDTIARSAKNKMGKVTSNIFEAAGCGQDPF